MQRDASSYYDSAYFGWQRALGEFGGLANLYKFAKYVDSNANVLDFGCGGGYLLANLECRGKIGIDPNPAAQQEARGKGIICYETCDDVDDGWADVIISNSVLEHTAHPMSELMRLRPKLRDGGLIVFSLAHETLNWRYA